MSMVEKLTIQGIRSFGPNSEDMQAIKFTSPVTLILGENGCGKTTIIECIKYALTGELPPGSDRGKSFVHDPKIFHLPDCLGQIKTMISNINGARTTVCRSMRISFRGGKPSFETLDSTLSNEKDAITKRSNDVDKEISDFMGVSKAIINNVLFCHQEDSSWPLDEPKKLKEKFDAIFGITEYNKAIEKLIKIRKNHEVDLKIKVTELGLLAHLKREMESKTLSLQQAKQKRDIVKEQCDRCDDEVKPIEIRLLEIRSLEMEYTKYESLRVELVTKQKNCAEHRASLLKKIKYKFEGSVGDVDRELSQFDRKMSEKRRELSEKNKELVALKKRENDLQKLIFEHESKIKSFIQQRQKEQEQIGQRAEKIKALSHVLSLAVDDDLEQRSDRVDQALEDLQNALLSEEVAIAELTAQYDEADQKRQADIDTLRVSLTKLEEQGLSLQRQKLQNEKERLGIDRQIQEIEVSASRLKIITQDIKLLEDCLESSTANLNLPSLRQDINEGKDKVFSLQNQYKEVDSRLTFLNSISKTLAEINLKEGERAKKEQEVRRIKGKHSENFKKVFTRPVDSNYRRNLQTAYESFRRQIKNLSDKENTLKLQEQSFEIKRKSIRDDLMKMEKDLEESNEKIYDICHATPYEALLAKAEETVNKYQLEVGALRSSSDIYKRYIQKIADDPLCPLCHKDLTADDVAELRCELTDSLQNLPENINRAQKLFKAEQKKYEKLVHLKPIIEKVARLEKDIPNQKNELKIVQEKLAECLNEIENMELLMAEPHANLELANSMLGDMSLLEEAIKDVTRLNTEIAKLKGKLPENYESDVSIDDLQEQKEKISKDLEDGMKSIESMQRDYEKATETLNSLREKRNKLKDEQIKLQEGVQSLPSLKDRQTQLVQLIKTAAEEIQISKTKVQPLKQKLKEAIMEKAHQKEANRKSLAKRTAEFDALRNQLNDISRLHADILESQRLNLDEQIARLKETNKTKKTEHAQATEEISRASSALDQLKEECRNQEAEERNLKDNRELMIYEAKEKDLAVEHEELLKRLGNLDCRSIIREKKDLNAKRDKATVRKGELLGQIGEINNQIKNLERDIAAPKYKNALQTYRRAQYEVEARQLLIKDLGLLRVSVEWSLIRFHAEKMENINRLIREYWRLIYRGNDIDYIQIETSDESRPTEKSADRKRSYNYRVIQCKNGTDIEMRGRCSAGQRVLASLIIRMALAETFSSNCGVLALDEPTTNLDRQNIISLCEALNRIVEERQSQSSFMLIIITHDENFISALGKIKTYHRVLRDNDSKSMIREVQLA